jgi:hypothetical protein
VDDRGRVILSRYHRTHASDMNESKTNQSQINGLEITESIQTIPFDLEKTFLNVFEKIFETLGIDNPKEQDAVFVNNLTKRVSELKQSNFDNPARV